MVLITTIEADTDNTAQNTKVKQILSHRVFIRVLISSFAFLLLHTENSTTRQTTTVMRTTETTTEKLSGTTTTTMLTRRVEKLLLGILANTCFVVAMTFAFILLGFSNIVLIAFYLITMITIFLLVGLCFIVWVVLMMPIKTCNSLLEFCCFNNFEPSMSLHCGEDNIEIFFEWVDEKLLHRNALKLFPIICRTLWKSWTNATVTPTMLHAYLDFHIHQCYPYTPFSIFQSSLKFFLLIAPRQMLHKQDNLGRTPLMLLIRFYRAHLYRTRNKHSEIIEVIQLFLKKGGSNNILLQIPDNKGFLPLHQSCEDYYHLSIIQFIADGYPQAIEQQDEDGHYPHDFLNDHSGWYLKDQIICKYVQKIANMRNIPDVVTHQILEFAKIVE